MARAAPLRFQVMNLAMNTGIDADEVAELVVQGIKEDQFYLFPHPEMKASAEERSAEVLAAFGEADPERVALQERFMSRLLTQ